MPRIALTGGSGFIGRHVLEALLAAGHEVRCLAHAGGRSLPSSVSTVTGDVRSESTMLRLLQGCDVVVHLAASYADEDTMQDVIVNGTRRVVAAAQSAGLRHFIMVSCLGAEAASHSAFYRAKWQAEVLVRQAEDGLPYAILRPSVVVGRRDIVLQGMASLVKHFPVVPVPGSGQERCQPVDVADLARCVVTSVSDETPSGRMVSIGGPLFVTYRQLVDLVAGMLGVARPKVLLPPRALPWIAPLAPSQARSLMSPFRLDAFEHGVVASPGIVQREFGFEPVSLLDALPRYLA